VRILLEGGANGCPNREAAAAAGGFDNNYLRLIGQRRFCSPRVPLIRRSCGCSWIMEPIPCPPPTTNAAHGRCRHGVVQGQSIGAPADRLEAVRLALELAEM
jgi:hypothetical protein